MLSNAEQQEILRRRTFAIISHPDAGKTTLTEKLLLYGGAIHVAGAVKSNKIRKTATSDWMEIEKQRGISVATSVMGFDYETSSESPSMRGQGEEVWFATISTFWILRDTKILRKTLFVR